MCVFVGGCAGRSALCDDGQMCGCDEVMLTADYPDGMLAIGVGLTNATFITALFLQHVPNDVASFWIPL